MPIFREENGLGVKFFIQKDLSDVVKQELCEAIGALGGRVETKVPIRGYVLIQLGTSEAERLRHCWATSDRPDRHFVPYTFVEACKTAGTLLKQIFHYQGSPITMHIHPSICNVNARNALSDRIIHSGGDPYASAESARVILADPDTEIFKNLIKIYQGVADKHIEPYLWVKRCIEKGVLEYTPLMYRNPGGRRAGEERTPFTDEDEERLCGWIALKIPYKDKGGRTGNKLYQKLCELSSDPEYAWVARHPWQSWRERYKKNSVRLDARIAAIVERNQPVPGASGQYGYVRPLDDKPKRPRRQRTKTDEPIMQVHGDTLAVDRATLSPGLTQSSAFDDDDDDDEWAVKIGNAPPPTWAKRRIASDAEESNRKRPRHDKTIQDIATEFRFTSEEVQEYYEKCGDVTKTRSRFQRMRKAFTQIADD